MPIFEDNNFRKARRAAHLTMNEAGKLIGVDPLTILAWESGKCVPREKNIEKAAKVYGVPAAELREQ